MFGRARDHGVYCIGEVKVSVAVRTGAREAEERRRCSEQRVSLRRGLRQVGLEIFEEQLDAELPNFRKEFAQRLGTHVLDHQLLAPGQGAVQNFSSGYSHVSPWPQLPWPRLPWPQRPWPQHAPAARLEPRQH